MILPKEKMAEFGEAAKPLIKWLSENCHPHCTVLVTTSNAELVEGIANIVNTEFIRD